ncbi:MAG: acylphosphatase [Oscillospiraceae bacterium]|nr:acylphosphatase [Oscillospiraceae bacterium]
MQNGWGQIRVTSPADSSSYLGLTGWVENLWDGRVEMEVQGDEESIAQFLKELRPQRLLIINDMEIRELEPIERERSFRTTGY